MDSRKYLEVGVESRFPLLLDAFVLVLENLVVMVPVCILPVPRSAVGSKMSTLPLNRSALRTLTLAGSKNCDSYENRQDRPI